MQSRGLFLSIFVVAFANIAVFGQSVVNKLDGEDTPLIVPECLLAPFDESPVALHLNTRLTPAAQQARAALQQQLDPAASHRIWLKLRIPSAALPPGRHALDIVDLSAKKPETIEAGSVLARGLLLSRSDNRGRRVRLLVDRLHLSRVHRRGLIGLPDRAGGACRSRFAVELHYGRLHQPYIKTIHWRAAS